MSESHVPSDCAAECPLAAAAPVPVPVLGEGALDRRAFLTQSMLAAAALALAGCAGGSDATAPTSVSASLRVADYPALATTGGVALVSVDGAPLAIVRTGSASFVALSRVCPHEGGIVGTSGTGFQCPRHGARFDATGAWTGGQPTTSLHAYATAYDAASGVLTIG